MAVGLARIIHVDPKVIQLLHAQLNGACNFLAHKCYNASTTRNMRYRRFDR